MSATLSWRGIARGSKRKGGIVETALVIFLLSFISFWGLLTIGQIIGGTIYLRRYNRLHGRYPKREDVRWWVWQLLNPVGWRSRGIFVPTRRRRGDRGDAGGDGGGGGNKFGL